MGKSSGVAIAIIGLIIGGAGLGLGAYSYINFQAQIDALDGKIDDVEDIVDEISVRGMWYDELIADWQPSAINTNETITGLSVTFTINEGEKAYFLFVSRVHYFGAAGYNWMLFRFALDGVIINSPAQAAGSTNLDETAQFIPVSLQYSTDTLSTGTHTVTIVSESRTLTAYARTSTLMVQTYVD